MKYETYKLAVSVIRRGYYLESDAQLYKACRMALSTAAAVLGEDEPTTDELNIFNSCVFDARATLYAQSGLDNYYDLTGIKQP